MGLFGFPEQQCFTCGLEKVRRTYTFYNLLNEGLLYKYCRDAGPIHAMSVTYQKKQDIRILQKRKHFDTIEIDFIGNFSEEKTLLSDLTEPILIKTSLNNILGTLFIKNNSYEDLILELT